MSGYKIDPKLLEAMRQKLQTTKQIPAAAPELKFVGTDRFGNAITYNAKQQQAIDIASSGKDCIVLGAAGTGKTTITKQIMQNLIVSGKAGVLTGGHKYLKPGTPGIAVVAYTRRAVMNIKKNMPADMKENCITIHKLLEYQPVFYEVMDPESGQTVRKMKFEETRNEYNPLPASLNIIVVEESSMCALELEQKILRACHHKPQIIYLGDIQQLPPTFGTAVLGYRMLELQETTTELTEVYRQALESPIISLAHRVLSGKPLPASEFDSIKRDKQLGFNPWKKKISAENACTLFCNFITKAAEIGRYDPEEDIILCPFNVNFGTEEINKAVAQFLANKAGRPVYEVIAGFNKKYFSVGEKVLYEREDAIITGIAYNAAYSGKRPQMHSKTLNYWGLDAQHTATAEDDDTDFLLAQIAPGSLEDPEERVHLASHTITIELCESGQEVDIDTAAEINSLILGYALTVHKAQGSEWRRVFLALHQSHATMVSRELLYTAVTRAKEELYIVCESETFVNGIKSQRIKGNTLAEKAEYFKGKREMELK